MEPNTNIREIFIKRTLIISPNLDVLLEHEDKKRAQLTPMVPFSGMTTSNLSSLSVSPSDANEEFLVGLPPPPRHPRVKLPRSTTCAVKANVILSGVAELQARETPVKPAPTSIFVPSPLTISSSISNPFINPAPTLAELHDTPSKLLVTRESSNDQMSKLSSYESYRSDSSDRSHSPIVFTSPWSTVDVDVDAPIRNYGDRHRQQNSVADSHSKPWRLLNSHAKRPSTSPGYTHISESSTPEPANSAKSKSSISISTTVYPPSDEDLNSYNDPVFSNSENSPSMDCPQISPIRFSRRLSDSWPLFSSDSSLCSSKPDLQTTPKPIFYSTSTMPRPLPPIPTASGAPLPSSTNFLDSGEHADLVRKTRKLARVFGETPRAEAIPVQEPSLSRYSSISDWSRRLSASELDEVRRHSAPLIPDDVSSMTSSSQGSLTPLNDQASHHVQVEIMFINDAFDDTASVSLEADTITLPSTPTQLQLFEEEQADERRRKREKLAKLHRFLGSRVPINLALGIDDNVEASLPSPYFSPISPLYRNEDHQTTWLKRRKSSSAILTSPHWTNDLERVKEELNEQEKLINVRRAVKMEKVYHFLFNGF
jgi:hypothetical protein